jgi:amino acid adenylation domain-containing protein
MSAAARLYDVVVNDSGQFSLWRVHRELPAEWRAVGFRGNEADCLHWIEQHWTGVAPADGPDGEPGTGHAAAIAAGIGPPGFDDGRTIGDLIEQIARRFPRRRAVTFEGTSLTYAELDRRSSAVAARLSVMGVGVDDVVGIRADRCLELMVALVGILRAGAAYLPLDTTHPPRRIAAMIEDARPALLVTDGEALGQGSSIPMIALHGLVDVTDPPATGAARPHPDCLAYVIFTSGSTGRPKGVQNTHRALRNRLAWMQRAYPLDGTDTVVQKTPLGFDVSVWELFWPLTVGAHLVLARPGGHRDPDYLAALTAEHHVTVIHFVLSRLRVFLRAGALSRCPSLRHVICSGEALSPGLRADFFAASSARLHNLYGPTEAAIDVTHYTCHPDRDPATVPIGRPICGVSVHVLGPRAEPVPPDVVGEIHIGGIGLARGYVNQPAMTADRFVPDPYGPAGSRLYRTGDLGRRRPDGHIEFLGRADNQVALRGFRIELGEVEAVIEAVPGVRQAVVNAWRDETGGAGLAAYLLIEDDRDTDLLPRVRNEVAAQLPDYMIPMVWTALPEFPVLSSGKVDRGRLPAPVSAPGAARPQEPDRPWTDAEQRVAASWKQVLGVAPASLEDDFFRFGGDSILAVELVVAARAEGLSLTVSAIFENATLRRLAAVAVAGDVPAEAEHEPFALVTPEQRAALSGEVADAYPLSTLMSGLVAQSQVNPAYRIYTTSLGLRGSFDEERLRWAGQVLLRRHPFLRSSIDLWTYDDPLQLVHHQVPDPVSIVDLRHLSPDRRRATFDAWFAAEPLSRFDWSVPPLLRLTVHRFTDTEYRLTLTEPFLDGWSVTIVLNELLSLYQSRRTGQLPGSMGPHPQVALLLQERAALADEASRSFWRKVLAGSPASALPPARAPVDAGVRTVPLTAPTSRQLRELAIDAGVSMKSVLLAAHLQVVALVTGGTDVVTGLITNSRPESEHGAGAVGMFLNTVPLRVDVDVRRARDLVTLAHAAEAATVAHRHYPYAEILRDNGLAAPLDTAFNYTHFRPYRPVARGGALRLTALDATDQTYHRLTAQFRLDVLRDELALRLEFAAGEFDANQADRIVGYYAEALRRLAEEPEAPVTPLDRLMGADERAVARDDRRGHAVEPAESVDLFTLFAAQARRRPEAEALRYGADSVTYAQLAGHVDRLAARLAERGIGPESVVAISLERSPGYVAAVLAVLRAGATYLPIDPQHPAERVTRMLAVSAAAAIITGGDREHDGIPAVAVPAVAAPVAADEPGGVAPPAARVAPESAAVLLFTSGSTGTPKGVLLAHRSIVNRLAWSRRFEPTEPDDVFLLRTPVGFVDAVAELFDGLLRGVPTAILPDTAQAPDDLVTLIDRAAVTRVTLVPTLLSEILRLDRELAHDLGRVRRWHLSGEPLRTDLVRMLRTLLPKTVVCNLYGCTEVTADATVFECTSGTEVATVPIGAALSNVTVRLVHQDGGLVPVGTPGEIAVGGQALAIGYLSDPAGTAQRFVPAQTGRGERVYRTGDVGVRRADGVLELLGRADRQVKVRGVRVEPAEVEANLIAHDAVDEAVVVQREHNGRPILIGYLRTRLPEPSLAEQLRRFLLDLVPSAAIPEHFVRVADWPRLPSGKVDLAALPAPSRDPAGGAGAGRCPAGGLELRLAELWRRELGTAPADVEDSFWHLGGHSLNAVKLARGVERALDVPFTVRDVYAHPTFAAQVSMIERLRSADEQMVTAEHGSGD